MAEHGAITGIGSMGTRLLMADLARAFERESGRAIAMLSTGGTAVARRIRAGESFDFAVLASAVIDTLIAQGHLVPARFDIARAEMVAAVCTGSPHLDIGSEAALREAILRAERIGYSSGPSGDHLLRVLTGWGLIGRVSPRLVLAPPGVAVAQLLAERKVDLRFQQRSEFLRQPGIEVVASLPAPVQLNTVFSAALCSASSQPNAARDFLAFALSPEADGFRRGCGLAPADSRKAAGEPPASA